MRTAIRPTNFDFHQLAYHFLTLSAGDRLLRFGRLCSDLEVVAYTESLLRNREAIFVVKEPAPFIAGAMHLEFTDYGANLGLSVSDWARRHGVGTLLLERAVLVGGSCGIGTLFVRNLSANTAFRRLARRFGMKVAWVPATGSTRLDLPVRNGDPILGTNIVGQVTLADHCLRFQWEGTSSVDSSSAGILESMAALRKPGEKQLSTEVPS